MFRFTIRELVLVTMVVALVTGWAIDRFGKSTTEELASSRVNAFGEEPIPGVPEHYWFLYEPNWPMGESEQAAIRARLPYEWIELERSVGPLARSYAVKLTRKGFASYEVKSNSPAMGPHQGVVSIEDFGHLCFLLEKLGVEHLPTDIRLRDDHGSHASSTTIRGKKIGSTKSFEVWEISSSGPIELWAAQMAIDGVCEKIKWQPSLD